MYSLFFIFLSFWFSKIKSLPFENSTRDDQYFSNLRSNTLNLYEEGLKDQYLKKTLIDHHRSILDDLILQIYKNNSIGASRISKKFSRKLCLSNEYDDGAGACISCGTNCDQCIQDGCTQCQATFYRDINNLFNCITCDTANGQYIIDDGNCSNCSDSWCQICPNDICTACKASYYLKTQSDSSIICDTCNTNNGFYINSDTCMPCTDTKCKNCPSDACSQCKSGYLFDVNGLCDSCDLSGGFYNSSDHCVACSDSHCAACSDDVCTSCKTNYYFSISDPTICDVCNTDGFYGDSDGYCYTCADSNCEQCNAKNQCSVCKIKTNYPNSKGICETCPTNKYTNNDGIVCNDCPSGTYSDAGATSCTHSCTATDCDVCTGPDQCSKCNNLNYYFTGTACQECPAGKYSKGDGLTCSTCDDPGCLVCSGGGLYYCLSCSAPSYYLSDGRCTPCPSGKYAISSTASSCVDCGIGCSACSSLTICNTCNEPTSMSNKSDGTCFCTYSNYFMDSKNICRRCYDLCATCSSINSCDSCVLHSSLPTGSALCQCDEGYTKVGLSCEYCGSLCLTCTDSDSCKICVKHAISLEAGGCACSDGYYKYGNTCIATCSKLCSACDADHGSICTSCVGNAELIGTLCSCTANSTYNSTVNSCLCNSGYTEVNKKCVLCKNYFELSEVSDGYYNSDFSAIIVEFSKPIDTSVDPSCSNTIDPISQYKLGFVPICTWIGNSKLKIQLGKEFIIRLENLYLLGTNIVKETGNCTTNYNHLYIPLRITSDPTPRAVISGPSSFSLGCTDTNLQFSGIKSTGSLNYSMSYSWSAAISPANSALISYISGQTGSTLSINRTYFSSGTDYSLTVTLKVTNAFSYSDEISLSTLISSTPSLQVLIDAGNNDIMKSSESRTYKASVFSYCGSDSSVISWSWNYVPQAGAPSISYSSILSTSKQPNKLVINPKMLPGGYSYMFTATASITDSTGAKKSGSAYILISVISTPLVIQLSKASGTVFSDKPFEINGDKSYDPDGLSGLLTYEWLCFYPSNNTACKDRDGNQLISGAFSSSLAISSGKFTPGGSYNLTLTIKKDARTASTTISLQSLAMPANYSSYTTIGISYKTQKVSSKDSFIISAAIETQPDSVLKWTCSDSQISISPNNLSMMKLPANTFISGNSYTFQLSVTENSGIVSYQNILVNVNSGAACINGLKISPSTGKSLKTKFSLSIDGCDDKDREDFPLVYTFEDIWNGISYVLGITLENAISTYLLPGLNSLTVIVCDQLAGCSSYNQIISIGENERFLAETSLMSSYKEETSDLDRILPTVTLFASSTEIDEVLFAQMSDDMEYYIKSQNSITVKMLKSLCGAIQTFTTQDGLISQAKYEYYMDWIVSLLYDNQIPINEDSQSIFDILLTITNGYISNFNSTAGDYEKSIVKADWFLNKIVDYITKDDLPGQSSIPTASVSTSIHIGKIRNFPNVMTKRSYSFDDFKVIFPSHIPFNDTEILNFRANSYESNDEYSSLISLSYATSGTYNSFVYNSSDEELTQFNNGKYPIKIEIPYGKIPINGWACYYFNSSSSAWEPNGCVISQVTSSTVIVKVSHFSIFKLAERSPESFSCDQNLVLIYIMSVLIFIGLILTPIAYFLDKIYLRETLKTLITEETNQVTAMNLNESIKNLNDEPSQVDIDIERAEQNDRNADEINNEPNSLTTEMNDKEIKKNCITLLEGHLVLGLWIYREDFLRYQRIFVLLTVIFWEMLLEGLWFYSFEDYKSGEEDDDWSGNYKGRYFGYSILAIVLSVPIEIFMIFCFTTKRKENKKLIISAWVLGGIILSASIAGISALNVDFCNEWSGYWALSFIWGIIIEIGIVQCLWMLGRYALLVWYHQYKIEQNRNS
ncbi:unnamed protein product [Blepharisma stoltei]|uniref:EGF-like domain-containing protein n=1 Tax=Blepharisma stoltei TaxID=1481888 RepID=A0AAU9K6B4_9CILI|nr:unnamed protein product [Blepharisma stoltei]